LGEGGTFGWSSVFIYMENGEKREIKMDSRLRGNDDVF
jgi:hypothetical protein